MPVTWQRLVANAHGLSWERQHPVTINKLSTQFLASRFCFLIKDPGRLGEMARFRAGTGRIEDELGICHVRMQESGQREMGACRKDTEVSLKGLCPVNQIWTN